VFIRFLDPNLMLSLAATQPSNGSEEPVFEGDSVVPVGVVLAVVLGVVLAVVLGVVLAVVLGVVLAVVDGVVLAVVDGVVEGVVEPQLTCPIFLAIAYAPF